MKVYVVLTNDGGTLCIDSVCSGVGLAERRAFMLRQELSMMFKVEVETVEVDDFPYIDVAEKLREHGHIRERLARF